MTTAHTEFADFVINPELADALDTRLTLSNAQTLEPRKSAFDQLAAEMRWDELSQLWDDGKGTLAELRVEAHNLFSGERLQEVLADLDACEEQGIA